MKNLSIVLPHTDEIIEVKWDGEDYLVNIPKGVPALELFEAVDEIKEFILKEDSDE